MASSYVPHFQPLSPRQDFFTWCLKVYFPAAYGPGFVAYVGAILAQSTSLESSILILRATNAAWLIALVALVRLSGAPPRTVALLALNSAFLFQYVTNAHNDILPVVLVVAAILAARRSVLSGALLVIAAALFKIPFAAIGSLAFVRLTPPFRRFGIAALTVVVSFGLSYAIGGPNYFATLAFHSRIMAAGADRLEFVLAIAASCDSICARSPALPLGSFFYDARACRRNSSAMVRRMVAAVRVSGERTPLYVSRSRTLRHTADGGRHFSRLAA